MAAYYFNLPPITSLTMAQQAALNETDHIALSGGPGTGKSVVSMWRHISNHAQGRKSLLLTYTTTLARYLEACCRGNNAAAAQEVHTSLKYKHLTKQCKYHEVIIDEAQDLPEDYFCDICSPVSYGADDSQILYPGHSTNQVTLQQLFPDNVPYTLDKNFRSTKEIMQFARMVFPQAAISSYMIGNMDRSGDKPSLLIGSWGPYEDIPDGEISAIVDIINDLRDDTQNIAILLPWKKSVKNYASALASRINDFSYYYEDQSIFPNGCPELKNVHITTFKSAKGLEFDVVIIPDFDKMNQISGNYNVEWQDYYVACTRARNSLFLFGRPSLNYPNQFVQTIFL